MQEKFKRFIKDFGMAHAAETKYRASWQGRFEELRDTPYATNPEE